MKPSAFSDDSIVQAKRRGAGRLPEADGVLYADRAIGQQYHPADLTIVVVPDGASLLRRLVAPWQPMHQKILKGNLPRTDAPCRQNGIALVSAMLILIMLTLLAVAMFRGFGLQQKIAGNVREKERAYQAAESALQYSEAWLLSAKRGRGIACTTKVTISSPSDMRVCNSELTSFGDPLNWTGSSVYKPPPMTVLAGGGVAKDGNTNLDINYAASPNVYVAYIGVAPNGCDDLYSITAAGYGGNASTIAVVQSVFFPVHQRVCAARDE